MKAGHVVTCYAQDCTASGMADVVKSSNPKEKPHKIVFTLEQDEPVSATCSCKAGAGGLYKHVVAVMLFVNDKRLDSMPPSSTSVPQAWGHVKSGAELYEPVALEELDCVRKIKRPALEPVEHSVVRRRLIANLPYQCVLSRHIDELHDYNSTLSQNRPSDDREAMIDTIIARTTDHHAVSDFGLYGKELNYYNSKVVVTRIQAREIALSKQLSAEWHQARRSRITGTFVHKIIRSRDLFRTAHSKLKEKDFHSVATKYGRDMEGEARSEFCNSYGCNSVYETGLIVSVREPFLACSPDGLFRKSNGELVLLEIKCPYVCKDVSVLDSIVSKKLKYLKLTGENVELKQNDCNGYYAQVQFALYVLSLSEAMFYVYYCHGSVKVSVKRDAAYLHEIMPKVRKFYFENLLPLLTA